NTPTRATNGGRARAITRAVSGCTYRRPGRQKFSPIASAPASTAANAPPSRLIPQILTRTIGGRLSPTPVGRPIVRAAGGSISDGAEVVHPHPLEAEMQRLLRLSARHA